MADDDLVLQRCDNLIDKFDSPLRVIYFLSKSINISQCKLYFPWI